MNTCNTNEQCRWDTPWHQLVYPRTLSGCAATKSLNLSNSSRGGGSKLPSSLHPSMPKLVEDVANELPFSLFSHDPGDPAPRGLPSASASTAGPALAIKPDAEAPKVLISR